LSAPETWSRLVPEFACRDLRASLAFYRDVLGFAVCYERPGFAFLDLGGAQLMLEQEGGEWVTAPRTHPYGRGVNVQIDVEDAEALRARILGAGVSLFRDMRTERRRAGAWEIVEREFLVADPDGYLLRFSESLEDILVEGDK
jgi:catechol 2,3-dioxygenase-like lactoylglutathione lyase family enzyme